MSGPEPHLRFLRPEEVAALGPVELPGLSSVAAPLPAAITTAAEFFAVAVADGSPVTALLCASNGDRRIAAENWSASRLFGGLQRQVRYESPTRPAGGAPAADRGDAADPPAWALVTEQQSFRPLPAGAAEGLPTLPPPDRCGASGPLGPPCAIWDRRVRVREAGGAAAAEVLLRLSLHPAPSAGRLAAVLHAGAPGGPPALREGLSACAARTAAALQSVLPLALRRWRRRLPPPKRGGASLGASLSRLVGAAPAAAGPAEALLRAALAAAPSPAAREREERLEAAIVAAFEAEPRPAGSEPRPAGSEAELLRLEAALFAPAGAQAAPGAPPPPAAAAAAAPSALEEARRLRDAALGGRGRGAEEGPCDPVEEGGGRCSVAFRARRLGLVLCVRGGGLEVRAGGRAGLRKRPSGEGLGPGARAGAGEGAPAPRRRTFEAVGVTLEGDEAALAWDGEDAAGGVGGGVGWVGVGGVLRRAFGAAPGHADGWYPGKYAAQLAEGVGGGGGGGGTPTPTPTPTPPPIRLGGEGAPQPETPVWLEGPAVCFPVRVAVPAGLLFPSAPLLGVGRHAEALALARVQEMGFGGVRSAAALILCGNDVEAALELLLGEGVGVGVGVGRRAPRPSGRPGGAAASRPCARPCSRCCSATRCPATRTWSPGRRRGAALQLGTEAALQLRAARPRLRTGAAPQLGTETALQLGAARPQLRTGAALQLGAGAALQLRAARPEPQDPRTPPPQPGRRAGPRPRAGSACTCTATPSRRGCRSTARPASRSSSSAAPRRRPRSSTGRGGCCSATGPACRRPSASARSRRPPPGRAPPGRRRRPARRWD